MSDGALLHFLQIAKEPVREVMIMEKLYNFFGANGRVLLLRFLARLHCGLLAAEICVLVLNLLGLVELTEGVEILPVYLRGLLFGIPVALSYYAAEKLPALWQFLLASLLISGLSWLLLGHPGGAAMAAFVCLFRLRGRLSEEKTRSALDAPSFFGFLPFLVSFCFSAVYTMPALQRLSVFSAVLYLLILLAFRGVERIEGYLSLNRDMRGVPARRVQRIAGAAVAAALLLGAVLLIPPALGWSGNFQLKLPEFQSHAHTSLAEIEVSESQGVPMSELFGEEGQPIFQIPAFVSYLLYALIAIGLIALLLYGVYKLFKNFRLSYADGHDVIEALSDGLDEAASVYGERRKRLSSLDRSPNAAIRRKYRKQVLRASKELPKRWQSPGEIEAYAGMEEPRLHELYEKARYSLTPCTSEDVWELKGTPKSLRAGKGEGKS